MTTPDPNRPPLTVGEALRLIAAEAMERRRLAAEKNRSQEDCGCTTTHQTNPKNGATVR